MPDNHVLLETITLTSDASSVLLDNIPQSYSDLKLVASARSTRAGNAEDGFGIRLNASTSGYTYRILGGNGSSIYNLNTTYEQTWVYNIPAATAFGGIFGASEAYIPNYTSSSPKTYLVDGGAPNNVSTAYVTMGVVNQTSTSAVTSITCLAQNGNLASGTTISLYGIAGVGTTPTSAPKATGGNIIANDGTYWYHAFLSSGLFIPQTNLTCDALVIAGGGSGETNVTAGGGAGGVVYLTSQSLTPIQYPVTVGAGAPGGNGFGYQNGGNSQIGSLTAALGGGASGVWTNGNGVAGGSGGGGAGYTGVGGASLSSQGNAGGNGASAGSGFGTSGGGGGAGGVGGNASGSTPGTGGIGTSTYSSWGMATLTGHLVGGTRFYAGGGTGGGYVNSSVWNIYSGPSGGGGSGSTYDRGVQPSLSSGGNGMANTGGGGGGGGSSGGFSGNGGSGIVIIRYPMV
jgi:hypothetical protein